MNMETIILTSCLLFMLIDYIKTRKIFTPVLIFNFIWFFTLSLYNLKISYLQQDLSERTLYLFILNILGFNITYLIISSFKKRKVTSSKRKALKYTKEQRISLLNGLLYFYL